MSGPEELRVILANILRCEYDGHGLTDCVDNDGKPYQSQYLADQIKAAESSLASPAGMEGWMPIETADKDADQLLLGIVRRGHLEEVHLGGYRYAYNDDEVSCWWSDQADDEICPTHWCNVIPLPAAPRGESE